MYQQLDVMSEVKIDHFNARSDLTVWGLNSVSLMGRFGWFQMKMARLPKINPSQVLSRWRKSGPCAGYDCTCGVPLSGSGCSSSGHLKSWLGGRHAKGSLNSHDHRMADSARPSHLRTQLLCTYAGRSRLRGAHTQHNEFGDSLQH